MGKTINWVGITFGALLALVVLIVLAGYILGGIRMNRTYDVSEEAISVPTDAESLGLEKHWAAVFCVECHGEEIINQRQVVTRRGFIMQLSRWHSYFRLIEMPS